MLLVERWMVGADRCISYRRATREAAAEYEKCRQRGIRRRFFRKIGGKSVWLAVPHGEYEWRRGADRDLTDKLRTISIADILGSVTTNREYDAEFHPAADRVRERWIRVAARLLQGRELPPVHLVRIENGLYVRSGFEVISIARVFGQIGVDAEVVNTGTAVYRSRSATR